MKKLTSILVIATAILFASCEGPIGPPGPPGEPGGLEYAAIYDVYGDFTPENNFTLGYVFPNEGIYETDVVLVYILWEIVDDLKVWRLLPQTVVLKNQEGQAPGESDVLQYNFDYTHKDVQIFLEFTFPPENLLPGETLNQTFRIAVVPADLAANKSIDVSDIYSILKYPNLELSMVDKINLNAVSPVEK